MDAYELIKPSGAATGIFACNRCGLLYSQKNLGSAEKAKAEAARCCDRHCTQCGEPVRPNWLLCDKCRHAADVQRERERFEKATKLRLEDYPLEVYYWDGDYLQAPEEIREQYLDSAAAERPTYVYAVRADPPALDPGGAYDILRRAFEDRAPEDCDLATLPGFDAFEKEYRAAAEKFNAANAEHPWYMVDEGTVILLDEKFWKEDD